MTHTVSHEDLYQMLVSHVRYAMGRRSYITSSAVEAVKRYWPHLKTGERDVILRDVKEELSRYERMKALLGDKCDHDGWVALVGWMQEQKEAK